MSAFKLSDFLPYLLSQASDAAGRQFSAVYKDRYGMLNTEWRVLAHLGDTDGMTATQIGALAQVHKTKVSRAITALEAKRFVTRQTIDADRRAATVHLTRAGRAAYDDLTRIAARFNDRITQALGQSDYDRLSDQLRKLAAGDL